MVETTAQQEIIDVDALHEKNTQIAHKYIEFYTNRAEIEAAKPLQVYQIRAKLFRAKALRASYWL